MHTLASSAPGHICFRPAVHRCHIRPAARLERLSISGSARGAQHDCRRDAGPILFSDTDAPWSAMMAAAIIYVLPPIALLFALRRHVVAGLTLAAVTE